MKGAVFIALNELVESQYGVETWEALLDEVNPASNGIYTSTQSYSDQEIVDFVIAISKKLNMPSTDVTRVFGRYLFDELNGKYPVFTQTTPEFFPFLESIENVIHIEVRKLYEEACLPTLGTVQVTPDCMDFSYFSPRKLCYLAEGLIFGAADFYNESIHIDHTQCMHEGHDKCLLKVNRNV